MQVTVRLVLWVQGNEGSVEPDSKGPVHDHICKFIQRSQRLSVNGLPEKQAGGDESA
jgi:hypothetical protein